MWNKNENLMEEINGKPGDFKKRFIKIKLDSADDLPLGKLPKLHNLTIIVRSIFQEDNKHYPQFFQMNVCVSYKNATI